MFSLVSGVYQSYFAPPKLSILIIGIDGSGKTSLLERIKVTDISTKVDTLADRSSYAKGAVAGVAIPTDAATGASKTQGGKTARLPPPLPSRQALQSRQWVEKQLGTKPEQPSSTCTSPERILEGVPPPPLANCSDHGYDGDVDIASSSRNRGSKNGSSSKQSSSIKPPLPKKSTGTKEIPTVSPVPARRSFIDLLRCPSPARYAAAIVDDEEEAVDDESEGSGDEPTALSSSQHAEEWNSTYLDNYHIIYRDDEEFDIKRVRNVTKKMFPIGKIRPTLGQNLAKRDLCGCTCSLFDLSGAEKMRPLWERYYKDTDAIIYVVNAAEESFENLAVARSEFDKMVSNETLHKRIQNGLPVLVFANQLDVAYREYQAGLERATCQDGRGISWNADEEDSFVGGGSNDQEIDTDGSKDEVSKRAVDFGDLSDYFGFGESSKDNGVSSKGSVFLFGGSARTGEGVRSAMEYLVAHAKSHYLTNNVKR
mmetsp:Transcript_25325/g.60218  ORF Transcript_25325/g.60218 Transcript_25325/m.60218 type:complete len:482 (+) Transcript_25325:245-1690(+)